MCPYYIKQQLKKKMRITDQSRMFMKEQLCDCETLLEICNNIVFCQGDAQLFLDLPHQSTDSRKQEVLHPLLGEEVQHGRVMAITLSK